MSLVKMLPVIGITMMVVKVLFRPHCWFLAVEAFLRLLVIAWISAVGG